MNAKEKIWLVILLISIPLLLIYAFFIKKDVRFLEKKIDVVELKKEISHTSINDTVKNPVLNLDSINKKWDMKTDSFIKSFNVGYDRFSKNNSKTYLHKNFSTDMLYGKQIRVAIAETNNSVSIAFLISYVGENWLFINEVKLLVDGEPFELSIDYPTKVERNVNYGSISETVIIPIVSSDKLLNFHNTLYIKLLKGVGKVEVKYVGDKGSVEFKLTSKQITGIIETLKLYEHLELKY